jgi:maltose/moltooligosaccharide transporter
MALGCRYRRTASCSRDCLDVHRACHAPGASMNLPPAVAVPAPGSVRPRLSFWQIWNMCVGFLGLQFGFALQNANVSRIFQTLGADLDQIPMLWIAAPLTGLLVQPIVGYLSDRTWTRMGRRRPYFLIGAVLAASALWCMPRAPSLWIAAALLWLLDASINISMEPFRALVGDQLSVSQRPAGYAMQSFFIGVGAVVGSALPWLLARTGINNRIELQGGAAAPDSVRLAFDLGAGVLLLAVGWTIVRSREYPPEQLRSFRDSVTAPVIAASLARGAQPGSGLLWSGAGVLALAGIGVFHLDRQLALLAIGALLWGLLQLLHAAGKHPAMISTIMNDLAAMPQAMRRLAPVQFFSWLALFAMWIYTTGAVTSVFFGSTDTRSEAYNQGANWVGVLFAAYNGFAAVAAAIIPLMVRRFGLRWSHLVNVWLGALALLSFLLIRDARWLLLPMLGIGFAWASILSLPYALLASSLPSEKMGLYMGIFNFFIVIPQLVAASILGLVLKGVFGGAPIYALAVGGVSFLIAGFLVLRVAEPG